VLPLVTTGATLHRLWFTGLLSFKDRSDEQDCPHGWTNWSSSCYIHINTNYTWSYALATCSALGSNLVDIHSKSENSFISNLTSSNVWTGGVLELESNSWHWDAGSPWGWTGWAPDHPPGQLEGCLAVQGGIWLSVDCSSQKTVLCEIKGEEEEALDIVTGRSGAAPPDRTTS